MSTRWVKRAVVCLAGSLVAAGCGGQQEQVEKPKVVAKVEPVRQALPGEAEYADALKVAKEGKWSDAAALFQKASDLLSEAVAREAPPPAPTPAPGTVDPTKPAPPPPPPVRVLDDAEKARARELVSGATVNRGVALERSGDLKAARDIYAQVLAEDPESAAAATNLARAQIALEDVKGAKTTMTKALQHHPEDAELLNLLAGILRQNKEYAEASATARKVLLRDQKNAAAIKTLALVYADEGKLQLAETFFRNALKLDDKDPTIRTNLGLIEYKRGEHQKAIIEFEAALAIDPNNSVALANIGAISLKFRDYARAAGAYEKAIGAGLLNCTTSSALGYAFEGMQEGQKAVDQLGKAYKLCPQDHELLFAMGNICMGQLRDNNCALEHFQAYTKSKPNLAADHPVHKFLDSIKSMKETEAAGPETAPPPAGEQAPPAEAAPAEENAKGDPAVQPEGTSAEAVGDPPPQSQGGAELSGQPTEQRADVPEEAEDTAHHSEG